MSRARASRWAVLLVAVGAALATFWWKGRSGAGAIEILVVDAFAHRAIANAFIRVCKSGTTGPCVERNVAGGTARVAVSADLDYTLAAEAPDYAPAEMTFPGKQQRVVVQLVPRRIPELAALTNGSGKVLDTSDRPIPGATV